MMKTKLKIGIIVVALVIVGTSLFTWYKFKSNETIKEGEIILEGYLVTDCPWQATPWLENVKTSYGGRCSLDIWLSENKPPERGISDICSNINNTGWPITSRCFLEKIGFDIPDWGEYPQVTLIGKYENMRVCHLLRKCLEPECRECNEEKVFVPNKVIKK